MFRTFGVCTFLAATALAAAQASAQDKFPTRVIRFVTAAPGSNHDWGARMTAHELGPRINQRVIVENRGSISIEYVAKEAPPDGHTVLFYGAYTWLQPLLTKEAGIPSPTSRQSRSRSLRPMCSSCIRRYRSTP